MKRVAIPELLDTDSRLAHRDRRIAYRPESNQSLVRRYIPTTSISGDVAQKLRVSSLSMLEVAAEADMYRKERGEAAA